MFAQGLVESKSGLLGPWSAIGGLSLPWLICIHASLGKPDTVERISQWPAERWADPHSDGRARLWRSTPWRCTSAASFPDKSWPPETEWESDECAIGRGRIGGAHLLVDLDGFLVVLELGGVLRHLQHALVGRTCRLLAFEVIGRLLVVLHGSLLPIETETINILRPPKCAISLTKSFASFSYISAIVWWCLAAMVNLPMSV